jgi:hypothetical protein
VHKDSKSGIAQYSHGFPEVRIQSLYRLYSFEVVNSSQVVRKSFLVFPPFVLSPSSLFRASQVLDLHPTVAKSTSSDRKVYQVR